jgi:hypothetical protein
VESAKDIVGMTVVPKKRAMPVDIAMRFIMFRRPSLSEVNPAQMTQEIRIVDRCKNRVNGIPTRQKLSC